MIELKPCPFCGGKAEIHQIYNWSYVVRCENPECGVELSGFAYFGTEEEAIEAWNRRIGEKESNGRNYR